MVASANTAEENSAAVAGLAPGSRAVVLATLVLLELSDVELLL